MRGQSLKGPRFEPIARNRSPWIITFADMMALLLTFFILMLSASTMDIEKYQALTEAMGEALGLAEQAQAQSINTAVDDHQQESDEEKTMAQNALQLLELNLQHSLMRELSDGMVEIAREGDELIIRFPESVAFDTASDLLTRQIKPMLGKIAPIIAKSEGYVVVAGHTDDIPINTPRFRSNWDLSSARAVSVIHELSQYKELERGRMIAQGFADTRPIADNKDRKTRQKNRRVEISVHEDLELIN